MADVTQVALYNGVVARVMEALPRRVVHVVFPVDGSWVQIDVEPAWGQERTRMNGKWQFAVWRATRGLYVCDEFGAVGGDPVPPDVDLRTVLEAM